MKKTSIVLTLFLIATLIAGSFAIAQGNLIALENNKNKAEGVISSIFEDSKSGSLNEYFNKMDKADVYSTIYEIEKSKEVTKVEPFVDQDPMPSIEPDFKIFSTIQGITTNSDRNLAALINGFFIKEQRYYANGIVEPQQETLKGKLLIGNVPFSVDNIVKEDRKMSFTLKSGKAEGEVKLELKDTYNNEKIEIWKGYLSLGEGILSYEGDIVLYLQNNFLNSRKIPPIIVDPVPPRDNKYIGELQVEGGFGPDKKLYTYNFDIENAITDGYDWTVLFENKEEDLYGTMTLDLIGYEEIVYDNPNMKSGFYKGRINFKGPGDLEDFVFEARVEARLITDGKTWEGELLKVSNEEFEGKGKIEFKPKKDKTTPEYNIPDITFDEDRADNALGIGTGVSNEKGFFSRIWKRIFG